MKLGIIPSLRSASEVVDLALLAEAAGFWGLGVPDTAPRNNQGCYPTVTACLLATDRLRVGPQVTNPISQHWSVHAAAAKAFEELAPGRFVLGIATGDGAVHSVGLRPATWAQFEESMTPLREMAPPTLETHVAASGPKGATVAGRVATDLELGVGLDTGTLRRFAERARAARQSAGIVEPLRVWALVPTFVVAQPADVEEARLALRAIANGSSRWCFGISFEDKGVPEDWQPLIRERLQRYDHGHHGITGREAPNGLLFLDRPDVQDYLIDRMLAVGTAEQVRAKLADTARDAGLDGIWVNMMSSPFGEDRRSTLERLASALEGELDPIPNLAIDSAQPRSN
jgi:alkanesulfonate monooxygenase SsuD/methylene tetrahydromethanopterin reductase-like flavin-dependent oxidoreductase (luciferase family)